jgi:hypothetical protein
MLSCKKIAIIIFAIAFALPSCMEQKILFSFNKDVNLNFLKEIPGIGGSTYLNQPVTEKATTIEVYVSSFSEKFIEKDNLLELTELNDSTTIPFITYKAVNGYSQDLYLLKYEFTYSIKNKQGKSFDIPAEGVIFFSIKHNGRGNTIGITPCYFGIINDEDNLIGFDTELTLKKDKKQYYLKVPKKNKSENGLMFIPAAFPENPSGPEEKFNIEKIVRSLPNKVGGYKPLVFDITKIFHDPNALQFHYNGTIHLTQ